MKTVTIHDAKTNLSKYISAAKRGENVYIGGFGKAEVVLMGISFREIAATRERNFSLAKGKVTEKPDAFSVATDKSIASLMYGD